MICQALEFNIQLLGMPISLPKQCHTNFLYFPKGKYKKQLLHQIPNKQILKSSKIGHKQMKVDYASLWWGISPWGSVGTVSWICYMAVWRLYREIYREVPRSLFFTRDSDDYTKNQCFYMVLEGHAFKHGFWFVFHRFPYGFPWGRVLQGSL